MSGFVPAGGRKNMQIKMVQSSQKIARQDAAVLAVFEDDKDCLAGLGLLAAAEKSKLRVMLKARKFAAKKGERALVMLPTRASSGALLVLGLGKRSGCAERVRVAAAVLRKTANAEKWGSVILDAGNVAPVCADGIRAVAEGLWLSDYAFEIYNTKKSAAENTLKSVSIAVRTSSEMKAGSAALASARVVCDAVNLARDFGNEPANVLYPETYAGRIRKAALAAGLKVQVWDEARIKKNAMGGILAVGMGSVRKPRLVILEHKPARAKNRRPVVLVGKGVTFDSGGISIKPSKAMDEMKFDMCGSSAVAGALVAAARLKLPVHVVGIMPLVENMPGGHAQRPGDIIRCYGGKTVEVLNTDAEGRLILADALAYAKNFSPACRVDIATLTGACAPTPDYAA
ncbi:MAG: leucyl aminopeptidase, partial [Candidatus Omnitrophica bacterium]|nr:leucyl aminopeptidase [Candidatus Omnitrophota bacterium]